jgi:parallel beta-helix repeat protein
LKTEGVSIIGNTLHVGGSGSGNYTTIQSAIDNASDGDTIFVYSGIYYENVIVDKSICLLGENKNSTIIDSSMNKDKDVICVTTSHVDIEKFTIKNGKNGILIDGDYDVVDNVNIVENIIIDNIQYGVFFFRSGYNNVLNNIISNNIYGIKAYEFCSNIIFGNIISSSSEAGIHLTSAVNAGNCMNNTISFNTLQNNGEGIILFTSYNNKINNNNFYGNSKDASFVWSNSNNWNYNYWNRARLLPKPILGFTGKNLPIIPWFNFDWHPAKEPYDIPIPEL